MGSVLRVEGLRKRFGEVTALDGCGFAVGPGQMMGLLGPNGAGKTTAMRTIFGLVRPDQGSVSWMGAAITPAVRRTFGYMPEERGLYPKMPVRRQLVYFGRIHGMERARAEAAADRWLEELGLTDRAGSRLSELSHGNQQRVQLVAAVIHEPELIVLDEPFSGLDPIASATMASILTRRAEEGAAVLFSSHQLDVVEDLCRDVVIVDHGAVVLQGEVSALRAASPRRYVELVGPGADEDWTALVPGAEVVERDAGRVRVALAGPAELTRLVELAAAGGDITQFVYEPPPLSEVFRRAVQR